MALSPCALWGQRLRISVIYPLEGARIQATDSTFIFGQVQPPHAEFFINRQPVPLYPDGSFLAFQPVERGDFVFRCVARAGADSVVLQRRVTILQPLAPCPEDTLVVDGSYIFPQEDLELCPGELVRVAMKATPGCTAFFRIDGLTGAVPMVEQPPSRLFYWGETVFGSARVSDAPLLRGIYTGVVRLQPSDSVREARIRLFLTRGGKDTLRVTAPGRLTVVRERIPKVGRLRRQQTVARTGPGLGYDLFLPEGVKLWITGREGSYVRARLSDDEETWVPRDAVEFLPPGTPPAHSVIQVVRTEDRGDWMRVRVFTRERLPFRVEQKTSPTELLVTFYGAKAETDWIRHQFPSPLIKDIRWKQRDRDVYELRIRLASRSHWGYDADYDGNDFVLDIRKPPRLSGWPLSPLRGLTILLDPGHFPDPGAVGPDGYPEKDANYELTLAVKRALERKGARVFLTRDDRRPASLRARPILARVLRPHVLLSLHHNALPDGVNPFENHGTSVYYYHPQSYPLAVKLQEALLRRLGFQNFGLYYDNLALCRPTQMPAVLAEPGFMMYPPEEMQIRTPAYRREVAKAVTEALEKFLKEATRESRRLWEQAGPTFETAGIPVLPEMRKPNGGAEEGGET